jgi:hypothetical protein
LRLCRIVLRGIVMSASDGDRHRRIVAAVGDRGINFVRPFPEPPRRLGSIAATYFWVASGTKDLYVP